MKSFVKIALVVALIAIIVLSIVVASVAWFTSNPEVDAGDITVGSARALTVSFDTSVNGTFYKYNGQIGNVAPGDEDAPYVYEAGCFTVNLTSLSSDLRHGKIKVEFGTVTIEHPTTTISGVLITDLFHVEANVYTQNNAGEYVKENNVFRAYDSSTDSELTRYSAVATALSIANNGELQQTVNNETSLVLFNEGVYEVAFTYTFLPDDAYLVWQNACNETASFADIHGYELAAGGAYVGVIGYTPYVPKYHYGLARYSRSGTEGNYTYTESADTENVYVKVVTSYEALADVTRYREVLDEFDQPTGTYSTTGGEEQDYVYIKIADTDEYVRYNRYNQINGFPYSNDRYRGEKFTFKVNCSVEEV